MDIYISKNGQQAGPYSIAEVTDRLKSGFLSPSDTWWRDGMEQWLPLVELKDIQSPVLDSEFTIDATCPVAEPNGN